MIKQELIDQIQSLSEKGLNPYKIANTLGITRSAVNYYLSPKFTKSLERRKQKEEAFKQMEEQVKEILPRCNSINHVCSCLGLRGVEYYYKIINNIIEKNNLDTSHFGSLYHKVTTTAKPNNEYFTFNKRNNYSTLKRLLRDYKEYKCEICGISEWNGKPIRLQVHHINGNNEDNTLENLQILCPNCHSQTETYAKGEHKENIIKTSIDYSKLEKYTATGNIKQCEMCGKEFKPKYPHVKYCCLECSHIATRKINPSKEDLIAIFKKEQSFKGVGNTYNISDNAIRKWFMKYDLPIHTKEMKEFIKNIDD